MKKNQNQLVKEDLVIRDFSYTVPFVDLLAGTSQTESLQIYSTHDFEVFMLTSNAYVEPDGPSLLTDSLSGQHYVGIFVLLTENATGEDVSDIPVPLPSMFGTGQQPFILPNTKILEANSVLSIQVSNRYSAQDFAKVELTFTGRKIERKRVAYA